MAMAGLSPVLLDRAAAAEPPDDASAMVREMIAGRQRQRPIAYLTHKYGAMSIGRAYEVQAVLDAALEETLGPRAGYKVAYASKAAQEQFGVSEPARGSLFALQRVPTGSELPADAFMELLIETEIAFTLGKRIEQPIRDVTELKEHVQYVHAAFDIGDYRFVSEGPQGVVQDMVASGVGAHFFVLGPAMDPRKVDVDGVLLKLARNGETIRASSAHEVLGSPWNSLHWLVNEVLQRGHQESSALDPSPASGLRSSSAAARLEPGTVVLTGTAAKAYRAKGEAIAGVYEGDCGALGKVALTIK
jgi:2-oxo-hept-3-ene-1,7-dioate hydratase